KMMRASSIAGEIESQLLADHALSLQSFRSVKAKGSRRPLRYKPEDLAWTQEDDDTLRVEFTAPKGSFATVLLDELMKTEKTW
ncbi:MAG: tRNA pseudouridine(13) synthase TruD, partial [Anaerolineae bacterium]|nr:tRNA pseudouridine(13) synthase TruD [Anaerolineae bacterium]